MDANEFKERMAQLPEPITEQKPPYWSYWRWELWNLAQVEDVSKFYEWPCIRHTMLVQHWIDAITHEWQQLGTRFSKAAHLGGILTFSEDSFRRGFFKMPLTNNLIHQAYHIQQWEQVTGKHIEGLDTIVEFGGGYGAMRLLCHELGFRGKYIIFDLPEFALLQEYYLGQFSGVETIWNPRRHKTRNTDLFIALYSLSEVEPNERAQYLPAASSFLFLYSGQWEAWDNVAWFRNFAMSTPLEWKHMEIEHLPDRQNWYSIGF